jgi:MFS family permease
MPSLCRTPDELTSVNVVRGALDSLSVIVGPLVAALLVAVADVAAVFVFAGLCGLASSGLLLRLDYERIPLPAEDRRSLVAEVREGFAAVALNAGVGVVVGFVVLQTAIRGAFSVFVVVVAIDLLEGEPSSVGVLQGSVGIGALVGSSVCTLLVGSRAMTRWLGIAVVLWGVPLALIGLLPYYAVALLAAGVIGVGNALVDVTAFTLIARMVPNDVLARVFGVLESIGALGVGIGALVAPLLILLMGTSGALIAVGSVTPVACLLWWRRLTAIDRTVAVRTDDILLLRRVPLLRPLPVPVVEQLAHGLKRTELAPGEAVFEAGDVGDSFYVVAHGMVQVLDQGDVVRSMGEGEGFGEIALLGNVTRTMTVRAVGPVQLGSISSAVFLPAVTSICEAHSAAEAVRGAYLDHAPGTAMEDTDP